MRTGVTLSSEDSGSDGEVQSTPEGFVPKMPFVGMKFDTVEAALVHYNKYAKHVGFSVKIESSRKSTRDGEKDKSVFVCNKSGKNLEVEPPPVKQRNRTITKLADCKAKMRVKRIGARWEVTQFIEEHTHEVIQKFALKKYLRSHKRIPREERRFIDLLHDVNLSSGRIMQIMAELYGNMKNVPYDSKTVSNYTATLGQENRFKDIPQLLEHFEELRKDDPNFFYKFKLDADMKVENIFWVDGSAREVYKLYNDCISFDTTYMTNMYNMPCAPFIGINRYGQSIQLGCGFLRNERIPNFVWLFETFLEAMGGLHPLNIITDQDVAMKTAILVVFLAAIHRNCRWHIMQKVQEKLGPFISKHEALRRDFNEIIDYCLTVAEFETRWSEMMLKHGVADNAHLLDLYDLRATFVPAYFMDRFFPFLQTTSRSEGFNAVLKKYVNPHDSLLRFFKQYMKLQERIEIAEDAHEFIGEERTVRVWSDFPMEKQMLETYTLPIYNRFQVELRKITSYNARDCGGGLYEIFPIQGSVFGYGRRSYMVACDLANGVYNCQCCKFSRDGILCCHAMKVMTYIGAVTSMPDHYILPRWSLPPPDIVLPSVAPQEKPSGKLSRKEMRLLRYGNLCTNFSKIALGTAGSDKTNAVAEKHMKALEKELADMKKTAADALKKKKAKASTSSVPDTDMPDTNTIGHDTGVGANTVAQDPPFSTTKGRPGQKRKKSGLQLQPSRPTVCSVCGATDHDARNCPTRIANPESYPLLSSLFQ